MHVLKFGGSSLATPESIKRIAEILKDRSENDQLLVVLSAFGGITNELIRAGEEAAQGLASYRSITQQIRDRHQQAVLELIPSPATDAIMNEVKLMLSELEETCYGVYLLRELSLKTKDDLVSYGERLSTKIICNHLKFIGVDTLELDSRKNILTDDEYTCAKVNREVTSKNIAAWKGKAQCLVAQGFIGSTQDGNTTTLGRGGSDYSAALYAEGLGAVQFEKWTDVHGMMTSDPRIVKTAKPISTMSYWEAMELCHFGAKIIYPPTIHPLIEKNIALVIKNTFYPEVSGTVISAESSNDNGPVKGLSSIGGMSLVTLSGSGMIGIPGFSRRLFTALSYNKISVALITQASSEHTITVGIEDPLLTDALKVLNEEFEYDLERGTLDAIQTESGLAIIALVGDQMRHHTGIAGKAFHTLGRNGVNIRAIAQGSSERNISIVIEAPDVGKSLSALHEAFFDEEIRRVNVFAVGVGNVGGELLNQIQSQQSSLLNDRNIDVRVVGISNSKNILTDPNGIDLNQWKEALSSSEVPTSPENIQQTIIGMKLRNSVMVDNTASESISATYKHLLSRSISVAASNKIAASGSIEDYKTLKKLALTYSAPFLYETNVGAGLPIIDTLQNIVSSGDQVVSIQAILSGSLNFIFNVFHENCTFKSVVQEAMKQGFTEPDPRIDLSGVDVQRKILILAREAGLELEMSDIENVPFLGEESMKGSVEDFLNALDGEENRMQERWAEASAKVHRLKYMAKFEDGKASVGLHSVAADHPFYSISGSDNIVALTTKRYAQPLIIQGAGAGAAVTAMGVFANIIQLANRR